MQVQKTERRYLCVNLHLPNLLYALYKKLTPEKEVLLKTFTVDDKH